MLVYMAHKNFYALYVLVGLYNKQTAFLKKHYYKKLPE